jgi:RNA polymerase-binding protein DksA
VDSARQRLEAEKVQTLQRRADLTSNFDAVVSASRDDNADDEHDPEGATIAFERSQIDALIRHTDQHLREIDAALLRLDEGTYGFCEVCGAPIGDERLDARPVTTLCIRCAGSTRR